MELDKQLIDAVVRADLPRVTSLLSQGANPNATALPPSGLAKLWSPRVSQTYHTSPRSVLMLAVETGKIELIDMLIDRGAEINALIDGSWTALTWAIQLQENGTLEHLIGRGADLSLCDDDGDSPLHIAQIWDNLDAAKLLIARGAEPNIANSDGESVLDVAIEDEDQPFISLLRSYGTHPNSSES